MSTGNSTFSRVWKLKATAVTSAFADKTRSPSSLFFLKNECESVKEVLPFFFTVVSMSIKLSRQNWRQVFRSLRLFLGRCNFLLVVKTHEVETQHFHRVPLHLPRSNAHKLASLICRKHQLSPGSYPYVSISRTAISIKSKLNLQEHNKLIV